MLYEDGHMAKSEKIQCEDGKIYDIDENGICSNNSNSAEDEWNRKIDNFINIALNERVENTGFIENQVKKKKKKENWMYFDGFCNNGGTDYGDIPNSSSWRGGESEI